MLALGPGTREEDQPYLSQTRHTDLLLPRLVPVWVIYHCLSLPGGKATAEGHLVEDVTLVVRESLRELRQSL